MASHLMMLPFFSIAELLQVENPPKNWNYICENVLVNRSQLGKVGGEVLQGSGGNVVFQLPAVGQR